MATSSFFPSLSEDTGVLPNTRVGGRRVTALVLDFALLIIVQLWIFASFGVLPPLSLSEVSIPPTTPGSPLLTANWFGEMLLLVVYFTVQETLFGVTVGKLIMGLRITDMRGQRASLRALLLRNVLRPVDFLLLISINFADVVFNIPYLIGGIAALCSPHRQRLGDLVAQTLVVDAGSVPLSSDSSTSIRQRFIRLASLALLIVAWFGSLYLFQSSLVINHAIQLDSGVTSYTVGSPTRDIGTITYPLHWRSTASSSGNSLFPMQWGPLQGSVRRIPSVCSATVTLRWSFFMPGWRVSRGEWECHDEYPDGNGVYLHSSKGTFFIGP